MKRLLLALPLIALVLPVTAADWPQWLGPSRNGTSPETGLLTDGPAAGPKLLWKVPGGDGYSSVAVVGNRAYTLVQRDDGEWAIALDAASGKEKWARKIAPAYKNSYGNGPRSTPAIDGGFVYVQSVTGPLACLKTDDGSVVWQHNLLSDFGMKNTTWGLSASPLVEGNVVLAIPGAPGAGVAAFDKKTGHLAWKLGDDKAAYASPVAVTVGGQRQLIFFTAAGLLAASPDGKELWRVPWKTEFDCNICTPLVIGNDLFVSSGEQVGCAMFRLSPGGAPEVAWQSKGKKGVMTNYWANSVAVDGYLYGLSGEFDKRIDLNCVDAKTGKLAWSQKDFGKGAITYAEGHLFITTKKGDLVLVRANSQKYDEKARVQLLGENRTVPTIAAKRLYLRDRQHIYCLDIAAN
jgi:outer membrane protein assembly factor BamB